MLEQLYGTLLIVEDEKDIIEVVTRLLKPSCLTFLIANNGAEALELIKNHPQIDAVISDINMPVMNGIELLSKLRSQNSELPFVFLTAYGDKKNVLEALRLGAIDFIDKPFDANELPGTVSKAIKLGQILKSIEQDIEVVCKESKLLEEKRKNLQNIKRSMIGGFFHYRKLELDKDL